MGILDKFFKTAPEHLSKPSDQDTPPNRQTAKNTDKCPYCDTTFDKPPKRKTKCIKCGGECYVRTKQALFNSDLLTEEDAYAVDFFKELEFLGATSEEYRNVEKELADKWGTKAKSYDIVWQISNLLVTRPPNVESNPLHHAKMVTFQQALYQLRRGHDPTSYQRTIHTYELQLAKNDYLTLKYIEVVTSACCDECGQYQGKKYKLEDLKTKPVLPIPECTNKIDLSEKYSWCACWYSPIYS